MHLVTPRSGTDLEAEFEAINLGAPRRRLGAARVAHEATGPRRGAALDPRLSARRNTARWETILRSNARRERKIKKKKAAAPYCETCDKDLDGPASLASHLSGRRHREKVRALREGKQECDLCALSFTCKRQRLEHLGGAKHQKAIVRERKRKQRAVWQHGAEELEILDIREAALADIRRKKKEQKERAERGARSSNE